MFALPDRLATLWSDTILLKQLQFNAAAAPDFGAITPTWALGLPQVRPDQQCEIPTEMKGYEDHSVAFARSLILKTPPALSEVRRWKDNPWKKSTRRNNDLLKTLSKAKQMGRVRLADHSGPTQ